VLLLFLVSAAFSGVSGLCPRHAVSADIHGRVRKRSPHQGGTLVDALAVTMGRPLAGPGSCAFERRPPGSGLSQVALGSLAAA
jgi:hypothetical protein